MPTGADGELVAPLGVDFGSGVHDGATMDGVVSDMVTAQSDIEALKRLRFNASTLDIEIYDTDLVTLLATRPTVPVGRVEQASFFVAGPFTNNTATLVTALTGTLPAMKAGIYAEWKVYQWRLSSAAQSIIVDFEFDGGGPVEIQRQEPKDPNAAQKFSYARLDERTIADGATPAFDLRFSRTGNTAEISNIKVSYQWLRAS